MTKFGINRTETSYNFNGQYLVSVDDIYILDHMSEKVGVLISEFEDLEKAYEEVCDKRDEYKEMLIENGIIEREYTKEELYEIERQKDREKIDELTKAVSLLIEKSKQDSEKIEQLTQANIPTPKIQNELKKEG